MSSRVFSQQENSITQGFKGAAHTGVDLGWKSYAGPTTPIIAHSDGTVTYIQTGYGNMPNSTGNASYGNLVKIKHPNGYYTLYAHLSQVDVKKGQSVKKGQKIGNMGNTGRSGGNHLHFEVRNTSDMYIDPAPYLDADLPGLPTTKVEETAADYYVVITATDLNIRSGPGTNYTAVGRMTPGRHHITAEASGTGASRWGKVSQGWISLDYVTKEPEIEEEDDDNMTEEQKYQQWKQFQERYNKELADKAVSNWAKPAVDWAKKEGVMNGDDDGKMRPRSYITREEMAQVMYNMHGKD